MEKQAEYVTRTIPVGEDLEIVVYDEFLAINSTLDELQTVVVFHHELPTLITGLASAMGRFTTGQPCPDGTKVIAWLVEQLVNEYDLRQAIQSERDQLRAELAVYRAENKALRFGVDPRKEEA